MPVSYYHVLARPFEVRFRLFRRMIILVSFLDYDLVKKVEAGRAYYDVLGFGTPSFMALVKKFQTFSRLPRILINKVCKPFFSKLVVFLITTLNFQTSLTSIIHNILLI